MRVLESWELDVLEGSVVVANMIGHIGTIPTIPSEEFDQQLFKMVAEIRAAQKQQTKTDLN
jgi:hypothetical protein